MRYLIMLLMLIVSFSSFAHKSSDSYLIINVDQKDISLQWDIAIRDLQNVINIDLDGDEVIKWQEVKNKQADIFAYALARLSTRFGIAECSYNSTHLKANERSDGFYAVLYAQGHCDRAVENIEIQYDLFFEVDAQHRGLLKLQSKGIDISFAFSPEVHHKSFTLNETHNIDTFFRFISEGIWHIWIGYDHILFLLSLLLPAVLIRHEKQWVGVENLPKASLDVVKIVTAFTIAHSLTLSLVILMGLSLPATLVESIIAFSVIVAALNNLYPLISHKRWLIGFIFGLIHGFGFANVLSDLELNSGTLFISLLGFNIGVELGQLVIVVLFLPLAYVLRNAWIYQNMLVKYGSLSIASIGFFWVIERVA